MMDTINRLALAGAALVLFGCTAASAQTTFFQQVTGPDAVFTYDEIYVPDADVDKSRKNTSTGTFAIPCIDGFVHENCDETPLGDPLDDLEGDGVLYREFFALDLNADGSSVVGVVDGISDFDPFDDPDVFGPASNLDFQAAVWKPDLQGFVLLDDASAAFALSTYGSLSGNEVFQQGSMAFDITPNDEIIVGWASGIYFEGCGDGDEICCDDGCGKTSPDEAPLGVGLPGGEFAQWILPIIWTDAPGPAWNVGQVLPMLPGATLDDGESFVGPVGAALAIDEGANFIAGWNGQLIYDDYGSGGSSEISGIQAVRWRPDAEPGSWVPEGLGYLNDEDNASVANDVNDLGQTTGWSGFLDDNECDFLNCLSFFVGSGPLTPFGFSEWFPRPFVDTTTGPASMIMLDLTDEALEQSFTIGEGRAISGNGAVAVGWVGKGGSTIRLDETSAAAPALGDNQLVTAAAWIHPGDPTWTADQLVTLGLTEGPFAPSGSFGDEVVGSVANAVDASGRLIVGSIAIGACECFPENVAAFWQLDDAFNLVTGSTLQDALAAAGVPISDLDEETEDAGAINHLGLTEATGVRMVTDPVTGLPTAIYVIGVGEGSFGSWIAALTSPAGPGLTTPQSALTSLAAGVQGSQDITGTLAYVAENDRCIRPEGTPSDEAPWCYFVVGKGKLYIDTGASGTQLGKQLGIARFIDDVTQMGGSFGLNYVTGTIAGGSSYKAIVAGVGAYAAHEPDEGPRGVLSVAYGKVIDATFSRVYVNGTSTATSTGSTSGHAYSIYAQTAYAFALDDNLRIVPALSGSFARTDLAGWTDAGGPFNATINPVSTSQTILTASVQGEYDVNADLMLYGRLELSAINSTSSGINAVLAGAPVIVPLPGSWGGLVSVAAGGKMEFDETSNGYGEVVLSSNLQGYFAASIKGGYNKVF